MFVRKKNNKSGLISIQVVTKLNGKSKLVKTIGSSSDENEIKHLIEKGKDFVEKYGGQQTLDFSSMGNIIKSAFNRITSHTEIGTDLLLGRIFDSVGFDKINNSIFKELVLARLCNPVSKLKTSDYLLQYKGKELPVHQIYRYLDELYLHQKEHIQQISYLHTLKVLDGIISVVFYDVTTLYFQIDDEDEIRKRGFSKEGKHQNPQIVLGLLVSIDGYPLAFDIFEGNKFEGYTMLPVLDGFKVKYKLKKLVIIADSGLLSKQNIDELQQKGYEFILGARIKSESYLFKNKILALDLKNAESQIIEKQDGTRLIISYSDKRAKKDKYNRERGLQRLEKQLKSGKLTKSNINNRGYNKYLKMDGEIKISIDDEKFNNDAKWDGLKGYLTNTSLNKDKIIENYSHLWKIEKAFRISKHDLKIRPIYHRLQKRIEAHITINFAAYKIYKELERILKEKSSDLSPEKAIEIAKSIYQIKAQSENGQNITHILLLNDKQKSLAELFNFG
jgi:transposase